MNRKPVVRVTYVSKTRRHKHRSKVKPFCNQTQNEYVRTQSSSLTPGMPWTTSTHQERAHRSKEFVCNSSPSFDVVERSVKYTSKDLRKKNQEKKKRSPKKWIILITIVLILIILAVGIYLIIRFTTQTKTMRILNPVLRWNSTGTTVAGLTSSPAATASQLNLPIDAALDSFNTLYIADYTNSRVQKWLLGSSSGTTVAGQANGSSGATAADLNRPAGLYVDWNDNIYVADSYNYRVQLWTAGASAGIMVAGDDTIGSSNNQLSNPYGVQQHPTTKTLYIADYTNHRVMSYSSGASTGSVIAGGNGAGSSNIQLQYPVGIYLDVFTNSLIIANFGASNIVRWVLGANSWTLVAGNSTGSTGNSSTTFYLCTGVTLDPMGNVYVTDAGNHRIQFLLPGQIESTTIAGISGVSGNSSTQLNSPYAVRLDSQLNLYVVDTGNHRIQRFQRY